jgi:hypothetical protein
VPINIYRSQYGIASYSSHRFPEIIHLMLNANTQVAAYAIVKLVYLGIFLDPLIFWLRSIGIFEFAMTVWKPGVIKQLGLEEARFKFCVGFCCGLILALRFIVGLLICFQGLLQGRVSLEEDYPLLLFAFFCSECCMTRWCWGTGDGIVL